MSEERTPEQWFRTAVRDIRKRRGWSQGRLVDELRALGGDLDQSQLSRIESGDRRVSLDEALAIATALGVSPVHLFVPPTAGDAVMLTPEMRYPSRAVRQWVRGQVPLCEIDRRTFYQEVSAEEQALMELNGMRFLLGWVQELIDAAVDKDRERMADAVDAINEELDRQRGQLEREMRKADRVQR